MATKKETFLSAKDILAADDVQEEIVDVPEWGGKVRVKGMSAAERDAFEMSIFNVKVAKDGKTSQEQNFKHYRAKMLVASMVDDKGEQLFSPKDIEALGKKSARAVQRIFNVATKLNKITEDDIEESVKN